MPYNDILVFDLETTGLNFRQDEIIEIGLLQLHFANGTYHEVFKKNLLIKPSMPLPPKIVELTNITDEMLATAGISASEALVQIKEIYQPTMLLVGYNIQFDLLFLQALFQRFDPAFVIKNDILDVMAIYKDFYPYPHRLISAITNLEVSGQNSHRALDDVIATYNLLLALEQKIPTLTKMPFTLAGYYNQIGMNPKYPIPLGERFSHLNYLFQNGASQIIWQNYLKRKDKC